MKIIWGLVLKLPVPKIVLELNAFRYFVQQEDLNYHNKWEACLRICIQELFLLITMEKIEEFVMILLMQILNKLVLFANLCMEQGKSFQ